MTESVLDASVVLAWFLTDTEPRERFAFGILEEMLSGHLAVWAPPIFPHEVAKGLVKAERRGTLSVSELEKARVVLGGAEIQIHNQLLTIDEMIHAARQWHCQVYDATYVALAVEQGLPLITLDNGMREACERAGVTVQFP